jgi:predicted acylesterase/phospholipase RssA
MRQRRAICRATDHKRMKPEHEKQSLKREKKVTSHRNDDRHADFAVNDAIRKRSPNCFRGMGHFSYIHEIHRDLTFTGRVQQRDCFVSLSDCMIRATIHFRVGWIEQSQQTR